ncbi:hypothetical protein IKF25_01235 [Candidatus Saccharibacteria bacterium]|nr:hypothetical protein [Candidatus Saccharibacteria bacterium]
MGLNTKLIQRITNNSVSDVAHSSGYADAQNHGSFGVSDNTTFSERQQIEQRRKYVQGYRNARIAQGVNYMPKAKSVEEQAQLAVAAAIARGKEEMKESHQEYNSHLEKGGLQRYDTRNRDNSNLGQPDSFNRGQTGFARQAGSVNRQEAAAARAAQAERFSGHAHPIPKTGGFTRH